LSATPGRRVPRDNISGACAASQEERLTHEKKKEERLTYEKKKEERLLMEKKKEDRFTYE
jgi:hypothetical protein